MTETILIVTDGESDGIDDEVKTGLKDTRVIITPAGEDGREIRGYEADVVAVHTDVPDDIITEVIRPMTALGGEVVFYG